MCKDTFDNIILTIACTLPLIGLRVTDQWIHEALVTLRQSEAQLFHFELIQHVQDSRNLKYVAN